VKARRRAAGQRGQAMLEYALITSTVIVAFALASQLGFSSRFADQLEHSQEVYYVPLPTDLTNIHQDANYITQLNNQISLR
jgi:hypothetical protein